MPTRFGPWSPAVPQQSAAPHRRLARREVSRTTGPLAARPASDGRGADGPRRPLVRRRSHLERRDGNDQVKALVFLARWALDEGESIEHLLGLNEGSLVRAALQQVPFSNPNSTGGVDLYLDQEAFPAAFAGDVDPEAARVMAATQRPWSAAALSAPSGPPAWKAIPPATQRFMAERAKSTIEEVAAS